jgi:hypothetical protein
LIAVSILKTKEMEMLTAEKAFKSVQEQAEQIKNDETQIVGTVSTSDVIRQGDLYLISIGKLPKSAKPRKDMQLAPGATQGSRHVVLDGANVFDAKAEDVSALIQKANGKTIPVELIGPVIQTTAPCELDHPEHGNFILPADEVFAVVYQRCFADQVRRQLD